MVTTVALLSAATGTDVNNGSLHRKQYQINVNPYTINTTLLPVMERVEMWKPRRMRAEKMRIRSRKITAYGPSQMSLYDQHLQAVCDNNHHFPLNIFHSPMDHYAQDYICQN